MNASSNFTWTHHHAVVIIVPFLMLGTFIALLGNLYLLVCIRWIRWQAMTANLRLSLSLAGADAWAAILLFNGWIINNIIPQMFNLIFDDWIRCYYLVLELLRLSGLITSAMHLLALALNHFFSIISPIRYQITMTPALIHSSIGFLWIYPIFSMFALAFMYEKDGFRSWDCGIEFYVHFQFRLLVFMQFATPLILMLFIYAYILVRLSAARNRLLIQKPSIDHSNRCSIHLSTSSIRRSSRSGSSVGIRRISVSCQISPLREKRSRHSVDSRTSIAFNFGRLSSVKHKLKAVITTLLILGTFAIGWIPANLDFILICLDCAYVPNPSTNSFVLKTLVNALIVAKLILNPLIYAYRLNEIRYAIWIMHNTKFGKRPLDMNAMPMKFRRMVPSVNK